MGVMNYGTGAQSLASPSLASWAAAVAAALDGSDVGVNVRIADAKAELSGRITVLEAGGGGGGATDASSRNVTAYGALCNAKISSTGAAAASSATFTDASAAFVSGDVGKVITFTIGGTTKTTTIAARVSATQITLASAPTSSATAITYVYGTDDSAAIVAAVAALPLGPSGVTTGTVYFPALTLTTASLPSFAQSSAVTLRGAGGRVGGGDITGGKLTNGKRVYGSGLVYTGSGSGSFITASDSLGFTIRDMAVMYANAGYTGDLVKVNGTGGTTPAMFGTFADSYFGGVNGMGLQSARVCLNLDGHVFGTVRESNFGWAANGVLGRDTQSFSNAITIHGGEFSGGLRDSGVLNPSESWQLYGVTFENSYALAAVYSTPGTPMKNLLIDGCGFWDPTQGGTTAVSVWGDRASIRDSYFVIPVNGVGIELGSGNVHPVFAGAVISGCQFDGPSSAVAFRPSSFIVSGGAYTLTDLRYDANTYANGCPNPMAAVVANTNVSFAPYYGLPSGGTTTVPGAPTIGSASAGNTTASVAFAAPASNGGSAITGYTATSTPGGFTGTGTVSPIAVSGLTNGTAYTFTVHATNSVGNSVESAASNSATPAAGATVPGAPTIGGATGGNASASVAFTAPASNGGSAITGYTATSTPGGLTGSATSSPVTVSGLTNGTAYTFTVHATNAVGNGSESAASTSVTPAGGAGITAPTDISGVAAWYDATQITAADASMVTSLADHGPNGYTLSAAESGATFRSSNTAITRPNNKNVMEFGGPLGLGTITSISQPYTIIAAASSTDTAGPKAIFWGGSLANGTLHFDGDNKLNLYAGGLATSTQGMPMPFSVLVGALNGASSTIRVNGAQVGSGNPGPGALTGISIGGRMDGTFALGGLIGEVIVYNRALTTTEVQQVEAYLKAKWGTP